MVAQYCPIITLYVDCLSFVVLRVLEVAISLKCRMVFHRSPTNFVCLIVHQIVCI